VNIELPHNWTPRTYQVPVWKHFQGPEEGKRGICVWHRRAGKDVLAINLIATKLFERVGTYWHCLPFYKQARAVVWNGKTREGRSFLDFFPKQLIKNRLNNEMRLHFLNPTSPDEEGSIYQAVGTNPVGVVFSEYSLGNPGVWDYVRPILRENGGWALFIYTPRGHNHGYNLLQKNKNNPDWFIDVRKAGSGPDSTKRHDGLPVFSDEDIEKERKEGMPEELVQQEYFVSFEASMVGAYYSAQMDKAEKDGRVTTVNYEPRLPVFTAWDIGFRDATSIVFFQKFGLEIRVIDYYESSGEPLAHYARVCKEKEYVYDTHYMPHDVEVAEWTSGKSRIEVARGLGMKVRVVPQHEVQDGIEQCRNIFPRIIFNGSKCERLLDALKSYRKEWDDERKVFKDSPLHDWSSHASDSFRYMCWSIPKRSTLSKEEAPQAVAVDDFQYV
jgi:phage terminase large subunit